MSFWRTVGNLTVTRQGFTATLLTNGNVLICGGHSRTAELFDPRSGQFAATGSMFYERTDHTATLLPDGKVIVAGGVNNVSTEIFDPLSGQWFAAGRMNEVRSGGHDAVLMPNGRVLVAAGYNNAVLGPGYYLSSAEEYDPATLTWTMVGSMATARLGPLMTTLADGRVLAVGGSGSGPNGMLRTAELYDPESRTWRLTNSMFYPHGSGSVTALMDGRVLVAGGLASWTEPALDACELYDPIAENWYSVGKLNVKRCSHSASLLDSGEVLVVGGVSSFSGTSPALGSAEVFDPAKLVWTSTASMLTPRASPAQTTLRGRFVRIERQVSPVLVTGGSTAVEGASANPIPSAEIYETDTVLVNA